MTESHAYTKKWKDFGRHAQFDDTETKILGTVPPDPNQADEYVQRDPNRINLSNIPQQSMHSVSNRPFFGVSAFEFQMSYNLLGQH